MDLWRHAMAFAPQQQRIGGRKGEFGVVLIGGCGQQNQAVWGLAQSGQIRRPRGMAGDIAEIAIVHGRAAESLFIEGESTGLDDVQGDAETCGNAHHRPHVLGDIGLVQGKAHGVITQQICEPFAINQALELLEKQASCEAFSRLQNYSIPRSALEFLDVPKVLAVLRNGGRE